MNMTETNLAPSHAFMLALCVALPWLNPFSSSPSSAVIPLLLSWMLAACALLVVVELPMAHKAWSSLSRSAALALLGWLVALLIVVPPVMDAALTAGLVASLMCVWLMAQVGRRAAANEDVLRVVVVALIAAAVISSLLGIAQYLGLAREWSPWVNQPIKGDAFANLRQRNQFASLTSLGFVALLGWVAVHTKSATLKPLTMCMVALLLNLLAAGVACSMSRTGAAQWVCLSALLCLWVWQQARQTKKFNKTLLSFAIASPLLVLLYSVVMPWLALQLTGDWGASMILRIAGQTQDYATCGGRRVLWTNALTLVSQQPWFGWGWGETDYAHFMTRYDSQRFCDLLDNAHDLPLHLALEFGVPFALAVMVVVLIWVLRRQPWRETHPWRGMAWACLMVLGMHSLVEYPLWYGPFQMTLGLAVGLLWSEPTIEATPPMQEVPMVIAAVLFIGCLYAAWDFNRVGQIYRPAVSRDAAYRDNPLGHAKQSWLFRNQAAFAELTTREVTPDNADVVYPQALRLMHYSPEARVVQRAIDSAKLLGHTEQAEQLAERLQDVKQNAPR